LKVLVTVSITRRYVDHIWGPGSSVGIAAGYGAGRSGIESRYGRDFPPVQTCPGAHPASCKMGTGSFPRVKCGRGVLLTTHPFLVPQSWKCRAKPLLTLWATRFLQWNHFTLLLLVSIIVSFLGRIPFTFPVFNHSRAKYGALLRNWELTSFFILIYTFF